MSYYKHNKDIDKYKSKILSSQKELRDILKNRKAQVENNILREEWNEAQKRANYRNEYERIRQYLETHSIQPHTYSVHKLHERQKKLIELGAKAVEGVKVQF